MNTMPGNPFVEAVRVALDRNPDAPISDGAAATLALAHEVRTVALLLASSMSGTAESADDQYDEAMRRMGENDDQ